MNQLTRYSAVPIGETFEYKNTTFVKSSMGRARYSISKAPNFKSFKKNVIVNWVNAWETQLSKDE